MRATTRMPRFFAAATHSPKRSRSIQEFAVAVELHFGGIEGENSGDADEDDIRFGGMPVVRPLLYVHDRADHTRSCLSDRRGESSAATAMSTRPTEASAREARRAPRLIRLFSAPGLPPVRTTKAVWPRDDCSADVSGTTPAPAVMPAFRKLRRFSTLTPNVIPRKSTSTAVV